MHCADARLLDPDPFCATQITLEQLFVSLKMAKHYNAVASELADEVSELIESLDDEQQLDEDLDEIGLSQLERQKLLGALKELKRTM